MGIKILYIFIYQMTQNDTETTQPNYECLCCDYTTKDKRNFFRHTESLKHRQTQLAYNKIIEAEEKQKEKNRKAILQDVEKEKKQAEKELKKLKQETDKNNERLEKQKIKEIREAKKEIEELKKEQRQAKRDIKNAKADAKDEEKMNKIEYEYRLAIEEAIPYDADIIGYLIVSRDENFRFNWINEANNNYLYPNLLIALKKVPKLYNLRIVNKQIEKWERRENKPEGGWYDTDCDDVNPEKYNFKDIEIYLRGIVCECPLLKNHRHQLDRHYNLLIDNPVYRGLIRRILEGQETDVLQEREEYIRTQDERVLSQREVFDDVILKKEKKEGLPRNRKFENDGMFAYQEMCGTRKYKDSEEENEVLEDIEFE